MHRPKKSLSDNRSFLLGCALITILKLWLLGPQEILSRSAPHDDTLFVGLALNILQGEWLGFYNQFTLMKGSGYPLFIAASNLLGIPLILSQELLYLGACFVFVWGIHKLGPRNIYLWIAFAALAFNPFTYNFFPNVYPFRFGIYPAISLLLFGLAQIVLISVENKEKHWKTLVVFGLVLGFFWNIRGEAIWVMPSLIVLIGFYGFATARNDSGAKVRSAFRSTLTALILVGMGFFAVNSVIAYQNLKHYGVYTTNEMKSPAFKSAYGGLLRIETIDWARFVPINREARQAAYDVSPAFKRLEQYFEYGRGTQTWLGGGSDYIAAYFPWAFRDAVYSIGYFRDAPSTHAFLDQIGKEIDAACDDKKIKCLPRYSELTPKWHSEWNSLGVATFMETLSRMVKFKGFVENGPRLKSQDHDRLITNYKYVTGSPIRPQRADLLQKVPEFHKKRVRLSNLVFGKVLWFYRHLPQILVILSIGIIGYRSIQVIRGDRLSTYDVMSIALLGGLVSYAFILTILQVTSYTLIGRQLNTTYPIVLALLVSSFAMIFKRDR
ncbi:hypothetical protein ACMAY5_07005 [Arenicellales bacterium nBUS_48]